MILFIKTKDTVYPCEGYFNIRLTHTVPNKWAIFAQIAGNPDPQPIVHYEDNEVYSGHERCQQVLDHIFKNIKDQATIDITRF